MKIRNGFVANSSSSSYVCDVCYYAEGGYAISLSDVGMCECVVGHTFCESHVIGDRSILPKIEAIKTCQEKIASKWISDEFKLYAEELLSKILAVEEEDWEEFYYDNNIAEVLDYDGIYNIPKSFCPICTMEHITEDMKLQYFAKKMGISEKEMTDEIKENFSTLDDFNKYVKN